MLDLRWPSPKHVRVMFPVPRVPEDYKTKLCLGIPEHSGHRRRKDMQNGRSLDACVVYLHVNNYLSLRYSAELTLFFQHISHLNPGASEKSRLNIADRNSGGAN